MSSKKKRIRHVIHDSEDFFGHVSPNKAKKAKRNSKEGADRAIRPSSSKISPFEELLKKCGFLVKHEDESNEIDCDQAIFQKRLKKEISVKELHEGGGVVSELIDGLDTHFKNPFRLKWALLPTKTSSDCESSRGSQQDSLIRLLLNIDVLQPDLIKMLTENFFVVAYDDDVGNKKANIPNLILANLRWLDHIVDPETISTKIQEMLLGSPENVQMEIISFVPNIVDDQQQLKIAEVLLKLYKNSPSLTTSILDTLPYLNISPEKLEEILHDVIKTLAAVRMDNLPIVMKFILANISQGPLATQILTNVRENIDLKMDYDENSTINSTSKMNRSQMGRSQLTKSQFGKSSKSVDPKEIGNYKILLFSRIKSTMLIQKYLINSWLKAISDTQASSIKPFDILILFLIYDISPPKRRAIEAILRNKMRSDMSTEKLVHDTIKGHASLVKEYFEPLKKITSLLFKSNNLGLAHYGASFYENGFIYLPDHLQLEVVLSLLSHIGDTPDARGRALSLLSKIVLQNTRMMGKYVIYLKGSLEYMDMLSLREAKYLLNAIIHLAFATDAQSGLQEEFYIMMIKHLSRTELRYKRLGVVNAMLILKNWRSTSSQNASDEVSDSESMLSDESTELEGENLKQIQKLFETVKKQTHLFPLPMALFMDELASIILTDGLKTQLATWIKDKLLDEFTDMFVVDCDPTVSQITVDGPIPVAKRFYIADEDDNTEIAVNIAPLVFEMEKASKDSPAIIHKLCPHIRLLRMLVSRLYDGDLDEVNAVLDCAIIYPPSSLYQKFESLPIEQQHSLLSCTFVTINWFRELVNAFVMQKDPSLKKRVYQRMRQVLLLQDKLCRLLPLTNNYIPPPATFDFDTLPPIVTSTKSGHKAKRSKKSTGDKKGKQKTIEESQNGAIAQTPTTQITQRKDTQTSNSKIQPLSDLSAYRGYLRELHFDVFNLLCHTLSLEEEPELNEVSLTLADFLLNDLNLKLSHALEPTKKVISVSKSAVERDIGFSHLSLLSANQVVEGVTRLMRSICAHLERISAYFQTLVDSNDGVEDALDFFGEKSKLISQVYTKLFDTLKITLSYPGLQMESNDEILRGLLKVIAKRIEGSEVDEMSIDSLVESTFKYISNFKDSILSFQTAIYQVFALESLIAISKCKKKLKKEIVSVIELYLKKGWYVTGGQREKGAAYAANIQALLKILFRHTDDPLHFIQIISDDGIQSLSDSTEKDGTSDEFQTLSRSTLFVYYRCLNEQIVNATRITLNKSDSMEEKLAALDKGVKCLQKLVIVFKNYPTNNIMGSALKAGTSFLDFFLRSAMPCLDKCLRCNQQQVIAILKNLQSSTRNLQHGCTHSKGSKDVSLTRLVPSLKKELETFVFRVKAMMAFNGCNEAFWLGNLKNRDLKGEELASQVAPDPDDSDSNSIPDAEDEQSDVNLSDDEVAPQLGENGRVTDYSSSF